MSNYYFNVRANDDIIKDPEGSNFPDLAAAHQDAVAAIREILAEQLKRGQPVDGQQMDICDQDGRVLETIAFRSVFTTGR